MNNQTILIAVLIGLTLIGCAASIPQSNPTIKIPPRATLPSDPADFSLQTSGMLMSAPSDQINQNLVETAPLSLENLQTLARQHNPTLIQAWTHVETERAKALQAGLYPNPVVGYTSSQIGVKGTAGEFQGGFIRQEIVTGGKLALSREKFLARASAAEFQALAQEYKVMNALLIQYYRVLGFQEQIEIQQSLLQNWKDNLLTVEEMFNVGQANEADILEAKVQLHQQQLRLQKVENELQLTKQRLITLTGTDLPAIPFSGELRDELDPLDFEESLQRLLQESPELGKEYANLKSDQLMLKREQVEPIPNINIQFSSGRNYVEQEIVHGVMAFVEVPIFDWNQGTIKQARADLKRQKAQVRLIELQLRERLAEQFQQYLTALQHVQNYRDAILPESEQRYTTQLNSYAAARETWSAVLEAQRDFFMRRTEYVDQLVAWRSARVAIEGMLLTDGLQAPQQVTPPGHIDAVPKPR